MGASHDFLTIGPLEKAHCDSATSEAAGYPKENLLDRNPNTYWKGTTTANQELVFDLGSALRVDAIGIRIHNYKTDLSNGGSAFLSAFYSSNGSTWGSAFDAVQLINDYTNQDPIFLGTLGLTPQTYQYWKLVFSTLAVIPEIADVMLFRRWHLTCGNEFPELDNIQYANSKTTVGGGRRWVGLRGRNRIVDYKRRFSLLGTTDIATLQSAYDDARGEALPLVHQDGTVKRWVQFDGKLGISQLRYQHYQADVSLITLPYADPSENY